MKTLVLLVLSFVNAQKKIWRGKCLEPPLIKNFNLKKYGGTWYEAGRYSMSFQSDEGHCGVVNYGTIDGEPTKITVNNSEIEPGKKNQMKRTYILGSAHQTDPDAFPNKLNVKFDFNSKVANFFYNLFVGDEDNYWVMETDYNKYSLVMSCDQSWLYAKVYAWIMVRDQSFPQTEKYAELKERLADTWDLDTSEFIENDVKNGLDCHYDYIEYY